jgi:hypothetical protein
MLLLPHVSMPADDAQTWHRRSMPIGRENQEREAAQAFAA